MVIAAFGTLTVASYAEVESPSDHADDGATVTQVGRLRPICGDVQLPNVGALGIAAVAGKPVEPLPGKEIGTTLVVHRTTRVPRTKTTGPPASPPVMVEADGVTLVAADETPAPAVPNEATIPRTAIGKDLRM
jgi:hypothetical protein